jgi:hypothetical protein
VHDSLRQSTVRVKGFLADSAITEPLLCGYVSLKLHEALYGGIRPERIFSFFHDGLEFPLFSEGYFTRHLNYTLLECSDARLLPEWAHSHVARFCSGNRFLVKRLPSGAYVALEHTSAADQKYKGMFSLSPGHPDFQLFRSLCSALPGPDPISALPQAPVSVERQRAFLQVAGAEAASDSTSISAVMFPSAATVTASSDVALSRLAVETADAHRAGADELSIAALTLGQSGLESTSDLSLPDGLVPSIVCSRCELSDCRADGCPRPCRLCDSAQGHEPSCLRLGFHEPTIQRFASSAEPMDDSLLIGVQAVYPAGVAPSAAAEVSGAVPALPKADLELLQRVTPSLLLHLSRVTNLPRTSDGVPLQIIFDDLPLQQRLELCRLFDRAQDLKHGSTIRDSARAAFVELCHKCVSGFSADT